jgi:chemotaxis protein MotB
MFGVPDATSPLVQDVDTAMPNPTLLQQLRDRLTSGSAARRADTAEKAKQEAGKHE